MLLGAAEDAVRAPDLVSTKAKMTELRLAGFTAVRVTSNWRPGLTAPTSAELGILRNIEAAARLSGVKVLVSVYSPGSATTPLDATAQAQFAQYAAALAQALSSFDDIIVGNEPNLNRFWLPQFGPDGSNASAPAYLSLLAQTYDALLLDLMLPDGCGISVLDRIRAAELPCTVCVVTGCDSHLMNLARRAGAEHAFTKPLDVERLMNVMCA